MQFIISIFFHLLIWLSLYLRFFFFWEFLKWVLYLHHFDPFSPLQLLLCPLILSQIHDLFCNYCHTNHTNTHLLSPFNVVVLIYRWLGLTIWNWRTCQGALSLENYSSLLGSSSSSIVGPLWKIFCLH